MVVPAPLEPDPSPQKLTLKEAEFEKVNEGAAQRVQSSNDPMEMLRQNRANEKASETVYDQSPKLVPRSYRRIRDYVIILVTADSIMGFLLFLMPNVILFAGILLFTAALTWGMLVVIDDY